jgi:hypothetical protein
MMWIDMREKMKRKDDLNALGLLVMYHFLASNPGKHSLIC